MKATLRHIYLCRTANMSWRTCVVVKQIQSNPISTICKTSAALGQKHPTSNRFSNRGSSFDIYMLNYCLTGLDAIGNEQIPVHHTAATEDPVENTLTINTDDATVLNNNTAATNDENNVDMAYVSTSAIAMKRRVDDDSSDGESRPNAKKMSAASSPASIRPDTAVSKEREGHLPRISTFPSAPKSGEQRANRRSLSPIRPQSFTSGVPPGEMAIMKSPPPPPPPPPPTHTHTTTTTTMFARNYCLN